MLSSFLRRNPWFDAPIVIIHDGPSTPLLGALARFPNVRFHHVGPELGARLTALAAAVPWVAPKIRRFYALEAFALTGIDRVVVVEGDLVCTGDAGPLFRARAPLLCCPDQAYFWQQVRDRATYSPSWPSPQTAATAFDITFNTGVMSIAPAGLGPGTYAELLARVGPETVSPVETGHTVSVVLNQYFEKRWFPLPERFNYLTSRSTTPYIRPRAAIEDAVFVHFLGRPKPWEPDTADPVNDDRRRALDIWRAEAGAIVR